MLETTQYNYQNLSKMYKEQSQIGHSKILSQVALGHSQSFILNTAHFENEILHLTELMLPNLMSSTMNIQDLLGRTEQNSNSNNQKKTEEQNKSNQKVQSTEKKAAGRPEKADDQKSEKTIRNRESMN